MSFPKDLITIDDAATLIRKTRDTISYHIKVKNLLTYPDIDENWRNKVSKADVLALAKTAKVGKRAIPVTDRTLRKARHNNP